MKKAIKLIAVFGLILMSACAPKKEKERIGRGSRSGLNSDQTGHLTASGEGWRGWSILESGQVAIGGLTYSTSKATRYGGQYLSKVDAIEGLISSFIDLDDPSQYENAGNAMGVSFAAVLKMPSGSCSLDTANSLMGMVVFDGIALDTNSAIRIYMGPERASSSAQLVNGVCQVKFWDDYGSITLHLQNSSGSTVSGDVYFNNRTGGHFTVNNEVYLGSFLNLPRNQIIFN